jgi:hypothetical protein
MLAKNAGRGAVFAGFPCDLAEPVSWRMNSALASMHRDFRGLAVQIEKKEGISCGEV